jgi:hypothetical protein
MDISKLPTDNLYKFIAIGGLIFVLIGVGFSYSYKYKFDKLQIEHLNKIQQESIDFGPLIAKQSTLERKQRFLSEIALKKFNVKSIAFPDSCLKPDVLEKLKPLKYEYEDLVVELAEVEMKIDSNKENLNKKRKEISLEQDKLLDSSVWYYLIALIGILIFIGGVILWYFKTQRILDKKLKNESTFGRLFDLRYEALKEINLVYYKSQPKKTWADMDAYEAYESVAFNQSLLNNLINGYLNRHSAILDATELNKIKELEWISNDIQFEIDKTNFSVSDHGIKLSEQFIGNLKEICDTMKKSFDKEYK